MPVSNFRRPLGLINPAHLLRTPGFNGEIAESEHPLDALRAIRPGSAGSAPLRPLVAPPVTPRPAPPAREAESAAAPPALPIGSYDQQQAVRPTARPLPPAPENRVRLVPALGAGGEVPGGDIPTPTVATRPTAPPRKSIGHEKLDYVDAHGKRGFKETLASGLYGAALAALHGGDVASLLGGFGGGVAGQLIDPRALARMRFDMGPGARRSAEEQREQARIDAETARTNKQRQLDTDIAAKAAQTDLYRANAEKALRPTAPPPNKPDWVWLRDLSGKNVLVDRSATDFDPLKYQGPYEKVAVERPSAPYRSSSQGIFNAQTGEIKTPFPPRQSGSGSGNNPAKLNTTFFRARDKFEQAKNGAAKAKTPEERQRLLTEAQRLADDIGAVYGDAVEVGRDQQGWPYVKPRATRATRPTAPPARGQRFFPATEVEGLATEWGVDVNEAKRRLQVSGYTIR